MNEVEIVVKATDRGAKETLAGVGESAKKMDRDISKSSPGVRKLRSEFDQTSASVRKMKEEFSKSGDMNLWKDIENGEKRLKSLKGELSSLGSVGGSVGKEVKKALADIGDEGGKAFGKGLESSALQSIKGVATSPIGLAVGVGLAAAISPMIGAAVGAGVTVGLGGGVLALGIARAAADPRVGQAWSGMWSKVGEALDSRAQTFVKPLVDSADIVGDAFRFSAIPKIGDAFDMLKPRITDLAHGSADLIQNMFKGDNFTRVMDVADRMLGKLASELPNFGNALNNMLGSIADGAPGIEQFWSEFLVGTQRTIVGIGNVIEALSKTYKAMDDFGNGINDAFDKASVVVGNFVTDTYKAMDDFGNGINDKFDKLFNIDRSDDSEPKRKLFNLKTGAEEAGGAAAAAALDFGALQQQVNSTAATADSVFGAAVDKMLNSTMALDQATLGFAESQTHLADSVRQNGNELDIHTAKGQANREAILGMVTANQQGFDANIRAGMGADQARGAYEANTRAIEDSMRAAGFNQAAIDGMIGKYRSVPANIATDIELHGLAQAIAGLDETLRRINGLDGRTANTYVNEIHRQIFADPVGHFGPNGTGGPPANAHGGITGAASGGPRGNWTMVGEAGRELVKLPAGSQVIPHGGTEAMMNSGGSSGGNHYSVTVNALDPGSAANAVVAAIKEYERDNGTWWRT